MEGYKIDFETPEGQQVPHWDEASNIHYDNTISGLDLNNEDTVQKAIEQLKSLINSAEGVHSMKFQWARNNNSTSAPVSGWSDKLNLPTQEALYLWLKATYKSTSTGADKQISGTPCVIMKYQPGGSGGTGNANIVVIDSAESLAEMEENPQSNTLYFFT